MTNTEKKPVLLKEFGFAPIIFLGCIEKPRDRMELMGLWGMKQSSRQLYQPQVTQDINQLIDDKLLTQQQDEKLFSSFKGIKKVFEYEAGKETNSEIDQAGAAGIKLFIKNWKDFAAFLETPGIRTKLLNTKNLLEFYEHKTENAKNHPIQPFLLLGTAHALYVGSGKDKALANKLVDLTAPMYTILKTKSFPVYFRKCIDFFSTHDKYSEQLNAISKPLTILFTAMAEAAVKQSRIKD